ncbi:MAG TPA: toprim domain-containing protein, partial [Candidatus Nitrosocosmicus sp.]|nr:toprim domain-containing protein [Candidatus Nitrosocosmicus sp.]
RGRIIFPLKDQRGNIVGYSGRILLDDKTHKEAKYVNTPETEIYHKRETLFGIDMTKENIRKENAVVVVEGEFDMLSLFQRGIGNVVAVKGSAVTTEQLTLIKRYTNKLILSLDSDTSGEETVKRTIKEAEALDFEMHVVQTDMGKDPDEAIKKNDILFKKLVQKPTPIYDFLIEIAQKRNPGTDAFSKKKLAEEVAQYITNITNPIVRDYYIKKLGTILDVEQSAVEELIRKKERTSISPILENSKKLKVENNRYEILQKYILSLLVQDNNPFIFYKRIISIIEPDDFSIPSYKKLLDQFMLYEHNIDKNGDFAINAFIDQLPNELLPAFDQLLLFDVSSIEEMADKDVNKLVYEFKRMSLKKRIKELMQKDENETLADLTRKLSDIEKKLQVL